MAKGLVLLSVVVASVFVSQGSTSENQRLFNNAVIRVQHLHQLAAKMISDFYKYIIIHGTKWMQQTEIRLKMEESLLPEERRQLSKIFPLSFCNSDSIEAPTGKDETQKSSVLKLLHISYRLIESWEYPSRILGNPNQITEKLADLKVGISVLIKGCLDGQPNMDDNESLPLPFEDFYQTLGDSSLRKSFRLLACFKKDMHKVETYLRVANCRRSLDSNCTL
uniref:Growth hormone n=1 Tax=Pygocentrus nattereri TaxID=42514 RepID=A0AAR2K5X4_PYGNA